MKTSDLFKINRQARRLNEGLEKTFGQKLNLENFDLHQLQDARNKIRTQLSQIKTESGFNETLDNDAYHRAQFMLDAINAEISEREEFIADPAVAEVTEEDDEDQVQEKAPPTAKGERMVKHIKKGYAKDGKLTDKEKSIAYATAWKQHNKEKNESVEQVDELKRSTVKSYAEKKKERVKDNPPETKQEVGRDLKGVKGALDRLKGVKPTSETVETGEDMTRLQEGEIQQASAIVTAKTMVDRVGRWIEELSGMENDTLLQLGDSIRDEMSQELAKNFISTVAPAIQQALQNLKDTRETLASGVRTLTGEEQPAEMLGAEPAGGEMGGEMGADMSAEPDAMNAAPEGEAAPEEFGDEFAAADAAAGGAEAAGREQRESIQFQNRLLKVLAG